MRIKRSATLAAYRATSDVVAKAAFFLLTVLAARRLSGHAFGVFALGSTLGWLIGVATDAGLQMHLARRVAQTDARQAGILLARWMPLRFGAAGVALAITILVVRVAVTDATMQMAIVLLVAVYVVNSLVEFLNHLYRGLGRTDIESTLTIVSRLATLGLGVCTLLVRPSVVTLALAMLVPGLVALGWSTRMARVLTTGKPGERELSRPQTVVRELMSDVLPIGIAVVLSALYFRIDVFLIEWWRGSEAVGAYNAVFRLVEALRLFPAAALAVALPDLCRATTGRDVARLGSALTAVSAVGAAVVWALAGWLIPFCYGSDYASAIPAFRVLLVAFPLMSLNYALTYQLIGWNRHRAYAVLSGAALLFNVALNARLIPELSIVGAAWTTVWTEVLLTVGCAALLLSGGMREAGSSPVERAVAS